MNKDVLRVRLNIPVTRSGPGPSPIKSDISQISLILLSLGLCSHAVSQLPETLLELHVLTLLVLQLLHLGGEQLLRDAILALLGRVQHRPELPHEDPGALAVQEPSQVDLHLPGIRHLK